MGQQTAKTASGSTVRIWNEPKKRLAEVIERKSKHERRPISEAEMVSTAVNLLCDAEEPKLGINQSKRQ